MEVRDLNSTEKYRLSKIKNCSICGLPIMDFHDVQVIKYRSGKRMCYNFFHTVCLEESRKLIQRV